MSLVPRKNFRRAAALFALPLISAAPSVVLAQDAGPAESDTPLAEMPIEGARPIVARTMSGSR